ncbi:lysine transporter LysE [Cupriavidus sp. USMAA2-4]|uniref:Lysine transporter LysE n=1 Tax=Cupriavidus malaysiensis TaxID=367825 RepID=A0ABN4TQM2_9BURK|nr:MULTISPECIES: LysE family translocator [Cupriavidus]AOY92696.1 lysine transporter LysE [Cupriavidus sp. USMAA2-4]AOZ00830.1 lysine transporter LysE [Cupriavidus sp. USMAHM13]AOZ07590.1 lysine transporter LysE [Cupriavidus malaysiensis]
MDLLNAPGGLAPQFAMVAGAHLLALLSPGPDFLLVVRSGLLHGPRRTAAVCLGIALGNGVFILLALAGLAASRASQAWLDGLQWAGCAYLVWLGWRFLRVRGGFALPDGVQPGQGGATVPVAWAAQLGTGLLSALLNPKNALFYASLFAMLAAQHTPPAIQAAYGAWMFCAVFGWDLLVAYGAGHPAVASRFARSTTAVGRCTGLALWGLATVVAVRSWRS